MTPLGERVAHRDLIGDALCKLDVRCQYDCVRSWFKDWVTACAALNLDPYEVISENQEKLAARYGEKFEVERSEVRKEGDL